MNANNLGWLVINEFGDSKTCVDPSSIERNGPLIRARVRYVLNPPGTDTRTGRPVNEMIMYEEYNTGTNLFCLHAIQFIYTDGSSSDPLSTERTWTKATGGNLKTLEFLSQFAKN